MLYPDELRAHKNGRGGEIRTPDILLPKQARYQTALHPENPSYKGQLRNDTRRDIEGQHTPCRKMKKIHFFIHCYPYGLTLV